MLRFITLYPLKLLSLTYHIKPVKQDYRNTSLNKYTPGQDDVPSGDEGLGDTGQ